MANPNLINSNITDYTTNHKLLLLQELQQQLWREFDLQVAVKRAGVDTIAAVLDEKYIKEKNE